MSNLLTRGKPPLTYREGNIADFERLKSLGRESYAEFSAVLTPENWANMQGFLESDEGLRNLMHRSTVLVCEQGADLIGMIYLVPSGNPTAIFQEDWSYIRFLGVHPHHRGLGIGKALTDWCVAQARARKERYLALHTGEFMGSARAIYEKMGFQKTRDIPYLGKRYGIYVLDLG